jgi:ribonuclease HI
MTQTTLNKYFKKYAVIYPETFDESKPAYVRTPERETRIGVRRFSIETTDEFTRMNSKKQSKPIFSDISHNMDYTMYFDGCSKGNPGKAGAGAVIYGNGNEIVSKSIYVGERETNNVAEYNGLILGMTLAIQEKIRVLTVNGDSKLVIKQIKGEYKVRSADMLSLYNRAKELETYFDKIEYIHIYRHLNTRADELSNEGIQQVIGNKLTSVYMN